MITFYTMATFSNYLFKQKISRINRSYGASVGEYDPPLLAVINIEDNEIVHIPIVINIHGVYGVYDDSDFDYNKYFNVWGAIIHIKYSQIFSSVDMYGDFIGLNTVNDKFTMSYYEHLEPKSQISTLHIKSIDIK